MWQELNILLRKMSPYSDIFSFKFPVGITQFVLFFIHIPHQFFNLNPDRAPIFTVKMVNSEKTHNTSINHTGFVDEDIHLIRHTE